MITLSDSNFIIQLFFLLGEQAIRHERAPDLQLHPYIYQELDGLCRNKQHLIPHRQTILGLLPRTRLQVPHSLLTTEKDYLLDQFEEISLAGNVRLGSPPSDIDLTLLAFATINSCGIATLEHSLLALALSAHSNSKVFTLFQIVEIFLNASIVEPGIVRANLATLPDEENLRTDDRIKILRLLDEMERQAELVETQEE